MDKIVIPAERAGVIPKGTLRSRLLELRPGEYFVFRFRSKTALENKRGHALNMAKQLDIRIATRRWGARTLRIYRLPDSEGGE